MSDTLFPDTGRSATISDDGLYRYDLVRRWATGPLLGWVMLNPSTADANQDDATIKRCIGFARRDGYAGIIVCNLFAYRATDPKALAKAADPVGPQNDYHLQAMFADRFGVKLVVAAWGESAPTKLGPERVARVGALARRQHRHFHTLALEENGPMAPHPLYIKADRPFLVL